MKKSEDRSGSSAPDDVVGLCNNPTCNSIVGRDHGHAREWKPVEVQSAEASFREGWDAAFRAFTNDGPGSVKEAWALRKQGRTDKKDVHSRLTALVDEHFGTRPTKPVEALLDILEEELPKLKAAVEPEAWRDASDTPLPEDDDIDAVFPTRSGRHDLYAEAMRMVGARYSKAGLVALVNWLLHRAEKD